MSTVDMTLADSALVANWISALGQALGALFTAVAVGVALWIAVRDNRQRTKEGHARAKAQAKLILVQTPGMEDWRDVSNGSVERIFSVGVLNIGERPILDIRFDAVAIDKEGIPQQRVSKVKSFLDPVRHDTYESFQIETTPTFELEAWRVTWEDPDGIKWEVIKASKNQQPVLQEKSYDPFI